MMAAVQMRTVPLPRTGMVRPTLPPAALAAAAATASMVEMKTNAGARGKNSASVPQHCETSDNAGLARLPKDSLSR